MGYVGLPVALHTVEVGYRVVGIDTDTERIERLREGESYLTDVTSDSISQALSSGRFEVTDSYEVIKDLDVVIVCVPTPLSAGSPDLSYVVASAEELSRRMRAGTLVSLESTTYPGTTEEIIRPKLEAEGLTVGADFFLCFSPERIDPGNARYGFSDIPKIVGGVTPDCAEVADAFYSTLVPRVIRVARPREAEMTKLLENTYRHINIALVNEMAKFSHELGIDIWEVIRCAST